MDALVDDLVDHEAERVPRPSEGQHKLPGLGDGVSHQEVAIFPEECLGVLPADAAVVPGLAGQEGRVAGQLSLQLGTSRGQWVREHSHIVSLNG